MRTPTSSLHISRLQSTNNIVLGRYWRVLGVASGDKTRRKTRYFRALVGVTEERNRLPPGGNAFRLADCLRGRRDHSMECRAEDVVTPAREEITSVHNNGTRLIINTTQS